MHHSPSRREKREIKFYRLAEHGCMSCNYITLFAKEAKSLVKHGFSVEMEVNPNTEKPKKAFASKVSWEYAFCYGIPLIVHEYIIGSIETFPKTQIKNWAQELYVIAARADYKARRTKE